MNKKFQELSRRLALLTELTGTGCLWKRSEYCLIEKRLPGGFMHHSPLCHAFKARYGEMTCIRHDTVTLAGELRRRGGAPFTLKCPAGGMEYIRPVRLNERILGAVIFGPYTEGAERNVGAWGEAAELLVAELVREIYGIHPMEAGPESRMQKVLNFLDANYRRKVTIEEAASQVFLSSSRLSHLFRSVCGIDFTGYLTRLRLNVARALLADSALSVREIAEHAGFRNQDHFSTIFKKYFGMTPSRFRRLHRNGTA